MNTPIPHFLLFSEARRDGRDGRWRFVRRPTDGSPELEVFDAEPHTHGERLELLAVVRGLESLDQPSRVTLLTTSRYVRRGIRYGLAQWRADDWRWERFGVMVPVKNGDLWQRLDRAMQYHRVDCHTWRIDSAACRGAKRADGGRGRGLADRFRDAVGRCFQPPSPALAG